MEGSIIQPVMLTASHDKVMRRYVALWALWLVLLLAGIGGICAAVDPYMVLGTPTLTGLTADKPAAADWPRISKVYTVKRARARTILLGGSTVDVGFNPSSPSWETSARPVFNLAIDGATPSQHLRFLQHALAYGQPTRILLGLSFVDSLRSNPGGPTSSPSDEHFDFEDRLSVKADGTPNPQAGRAYLQDLLFATLSLDAIRDSVTTLLSQDNDFNASETALGWNTGGAFHRWTVKDGYGGLFANKEAAKIQQLVRWRTAKRIDVDGVAAIVRLAHVHGIAVTVLILPNHADLMEAIAQLGLQDDVARWKADVLNGVAASSGGTATPVWDFSGVSPYTTEAVPALGDTKTHLRWFFEPVHFQPALAEQMLARMQGRAASGSFGRLLAPADLADDDRTQRRALAAWEALNPQAVARIHSQIRLFE